MEIYKVEFKRYQAIEEEETMIAAESNEDATAVFKRIYPKRTVLEVTKL